VARELVVVNVSFRKPPMVLVASMGLFHQQNASRFADNCRYSKVAFYGVHEVHSELGVIKKCF
jgi:hypothetical protein